MKDHYSVYLTKEVLSKIHLNGVMISLNDKMGLKMSMLREINFEKFLPFDKANIEKFVPKVKDYSPLAFSLKIV